MNKIRAICVRHGYNLPGRRVNELLQLYNDFQAPISETKKIVEQDPSDFLQWLDNRKDVLSL